MDQNTSYANRRRYPRKSHDAMVAVCAREEHTFESVSQISEGGLLLEAARPLIIGDEVSVTFFESGTAYPPCIGRVVYHLRSRDGMRYIGVRFEEVAEIVRKRIRELAPVRPT